MQENPSQSLFSCERLACSRQGRVLFAGVGVTLLEGGVLLVVGRNGCGKTTFLRCVAGLMPAQGSIEKPDRLLYLGHADAVKPEATVLQNLLFWAELDGEAMLLPAAIQYFGLEPFLDMPCRLLSAGWKKRVALARLLTHPAALWIMDEPYAHLDEEGVALLGGLIQGRVRKGGAVIMAVHHLVPGALGDVVGPSVLHIEDFIPGEEIGHVPDPV